MPSITTSATRKFSERGIFRENYGYFYYIKAYLRNLASKDELVYPSSTPVVSLTTHGDRIKRVFISIESILNGTLKPSRIILFISESTRNQTLPKTLTRLQTRGLEIKYCRDFGPHTKYYPYVSSTQSFSNPLVTADDDIIYPKYWLADLYSAWQAESNHIHCFRAKKVALTNEGLAPYREWINCLTSEPSLTNFATGVSGVIYPPQFLQQLQKAGTAFLACCPKADDIWLHANAVRGRWPVQQATDRAVHFPHVPLSRRTALFKGNLRQEQNDEQTRATYSAQDLHILGSASANK